VKSQTKAPRNKTAIETEDFKIYLNDLRHDWLKVLTILGFTLTPVFLLLDYFMIPHEKFLSFTYSRSTITLLLFLQYIFLRKTQASRCTPFHGYFISLLMGLMISWMTYELGGFDSSYYAGLNLVMIAVVILIPWGFDHAVINALIIMGSYFFINTVFPTLYRPDNFINNSYFLSATAIISVSISRVHFQLIRKEFISNRQLNIAKKEQDTIMNAVDEGLFVIHNSGDEFFIGEHQSESVKRILEATNLSGRNFCAVLSSYFPAKKIEEVSEYLEMISSPNIDENMIRDLNPLMRDEATIQHGINSSSRYLEFGFKKITQTHQKNDFLVSIKDVTKEVEMSHQMRQNEIKAEQETQMMLSILHIGPALLQDFMEGVETELTIIDSVLREDKKHADLANAVETIFRSVHSLKGNAALLDLKFLAEQANQFEEKMILLRESENLSWESFLPIAYELATLQVVFEKMKELIKRIRMFQSKGGDAISALSSLPEAITRLSHRIAGETGKKVKIVVQDLNFNGVPNKYAYIFRDILVQLTRNAIIHGIETPEYRLKTGKSENGVISIAMKPDGGNFCICFRDDGRSFDFEAIRKKAVSLGRADETAISKWEPSQLVKLTFEPGFSTSNAATLHAGRGMGMDIIKQRIKNLGGHLTVNFVVGQFTEFKFTVPLGANQE